MCYKKITFVVKHPQLCLALGATVICVTSEPMNHGTGREVIRLTDVTTGKSICLPLGKSVTLLD